MTLRSRDGRWEIRVVRIGLGGSKGPATPYFRVLLDGRFYRQVRTVEGLAELGIVLAELEEVPPVELDAEAEEFYREEKRDRELRPIQFAHYLKGHHPRRNPNKLRGWWPGDQMRLASSGIPASACSVLAPARPGSWLAVADDLDHLRLWLAPAIDLDDRLGTARAVRVPVPDLADVDHHGRE
jgi:hypothetical protein